MLSSASKLRLPETEGDSLEGVPFKIDLRAFVPEVGVLGWGSMLKRTLLEGVPRTDFVGEAEAARWGFLGVTNTEEEDGCSGSCSLFVPSSSISSSLSSLSSIFNKCGNSICIESRFSPLSPVFFFFPLLSPDGPAPPEYLDWAMSSSAFSRLLELEPETRDWFEYLSHLFSSSS